MEFSVDAGRRILGDFDRWIANRPRVGPPGAQLTLGVLGTFIGAVLVVVGFLWALLIIAASAILGVRSVRWFRARRSRVPLVVLSPFASPTRAGREAAKSYLRVLQRTLADELGDRVRVEILSAALSVAQARTVRKWLDACVVVFGDADATAEMSHWVASLSFDAAWPVLSIATRAQSVVYSTHGRRRSERRIIERSQTTPTITEGSVPLDALMQERPSVHSITLTVAAIAAIAAMRAVETDRRPSSPFVIAQPTKDMPPEVNVVLLGIAANTLMALGHDPLAALTWLVEQALSGIGSELVCTFVGNEAYVGMTEGWCPELTGYTIAVAAAQAHPDGWVGWHNAGQMSARRGNLLVAAWYAQESRAAGAPEGRACRLEGTIAWLSGDATKAYDLYVRTDTGDSKDFVVAECLEKLGDRTEALMLYRRSIARNPFRQVAVLHARNISTARPVQWKSVGLRAPWPISRILLPVSDLRSRSLLRTRGEAPGVHRRLGLIALGRGHLVRAERLLGFAAGLPDYDASDVVALTITLCLLDRWGGATEVMQQIPRGAAALELGRDTARTIVSRYPGIRKLPEYAGARAILVESLAIELPAPLAGDSIPGH